MKKYTHQLTKDLTPDNWKDKLNLAALSVDDLVDIFGDMKSMERFSKQIAGFLREVIDSRMPEGEDEYATPNFIIVRNFRERAGGLNRELIEEEMGEEWVADHCKPGTEYTELRITKNEEDA
jgi:hypothetical protein